MLHFGLPLLVLVCLALQATSHPIVEMKINIDGSAVGTIDVSPDIDANVGIAENVEEIFDSDVDVGVSSDVYIGDDIGSDTGKSAEVYDGDDLDDGLCENSRATGNEGYPFIYMRDQNIAFSVYLTTVLKASCNKHVVKFDQPMMKGKGFDMAKGVFTAPKTGVYQFTFVISQATVGVSRAHLIRKIRGRAVNVVDATAEGTKEGLRVQGTNTAIIHLLAGNQVYVEMDAGSTLDGDRYTTFSGHLLYTC